MPRRPDLDKLEQPSFAIDPDAPNIYTDGPWRHPYGRHKIGVVLRILLNILPRVGLDSHRIQGFMLSRSDIVDPAPGDDPKEHDPSSGWIPVRILGSGAFGHVGLWEKRDVKGRLVDEIAIKEIKFQSLGDNYSETLPMNRRGIMEEAVFQAGLQVKELKSIKEVMLADDDLPRIDQDPHILALRRYKFNRSLLKARMYLLYAPYRTLDDLTKAYKAFDQAIPEPFLWTLFHSLIQGLLMHSGALDRESVLYQYRERARDSAQDYILHSDIKPANVMLDYAALGDDELSRAYSLNQYPDDFTSLYPRVCLTDYGIAVDMGPGSETDVPPRWGTYGYNSPEQQNWGHAFQNRPNSSLSKKTTAHDIWAVGKIMLDIMTGFPSDFLHDRTMEMVSKNEDVYIGWGNHFLPWELAGMVKHSYSQTLKDLVRRCLDPEVTKRPSHFDILAVTQNRIAQINHHYKAASASEKAEFRLFFRDHEIHQIPLGKGPFNMFSHPAELWQIQYRNPEMVFGFPEQVFGHFDPRVRHRGRPVWPEGFRLGDTQVSYGTYFWTNLPEDDEDQGGASEDGVHHCGHHCGHQAEQRHEHQEEPIQEYKEEPLERYQQQQVADYQEEPLQQYQQPQQQQIADYRAGLVGGFDIFADEGNDDAGPDGNGHGGEGHGENAPREYDGGREPGGGGYPGGAYGLGPCGPGGYSPGGDGLREHRLVGDGPGAHGLWGHAPGYYAPGGYGPGNYAPGYQAPVNYAPVNYAPGGHGLGGYGPGGYGAGRNGGYSERGPRGTRLDDGGHDEHEHRQVREHNADNNGGPGHDQGQPLSERSLPPSPSTVSSGDIELPALISSDFNELRKELKEIAPKTRTTGTGITKTRVAKQLLKARRKAARAAGDTRKEVKANPRPVDAEPKKQDPKKTAGKGKGKGNGKARA